MRREEAVNALRLTREELLLLLSRLDRDVASDTDSNRLTRRWPLRLQQTVLTVQSSSTETKHLIVVPRNISVQGLSILHGGFLHPGSRCHVTLRQVSGEPTTLTARVARCRHIEKHLHEIGLLFMKPVDPRNFSIIVEGDQLFNADHVTPGDLAGRVMIIAESEIQAGIKAGFSGTELDLVFARDADTAMSMLDEDADLVYVQDMLPDMTGCEFLEQIRAQSSAKLIMLLPEVCEQSRTQARNAGAEEVLIWPCDSDVLLRSAAEYLLLDELVAMNQQGGLAVPIEEAKRAARHEELRTMGEELANAMIRDDSASALALTQQIHELAVNLREPVLTKRAAEALQIITDRGRIALDELGLVVRMCRKIAGHTPADALANEAA